jgi:hypothetical protein
MLTSKSTNILEENRSLEVLKVFLWSVPDNAIDFCVYNRWILSGSQTKIHGSIS